MCKKEQKITKRGVRKVLLILHRSQRKPTRDVTTEQLKGGGEQCFLDFYAIIFGKSSKVAEFWHNLKTRYLSLAQSLAT